MDEKTVLAKAVLNVAENLGLESVHLEMVLGMNYISISQLKQDVELEPTSKPGQKALLLINLFQSLYSLSGGDTDWMRSFMYTYNGVTGGIPNEQIQSEAGLVKVTQTLQSLLAK